MPLPPLGLSRDDRHVYTAWYPPAEPVTLPSVTTILGTIAKPYLSAWYAKSAAEYAVTNIDSVLRMVADLGTEGTVKAVAGRAAALRDAAGDRGTAVHEMAEHRFRGLPVIAPVELEPYLHALDAFVAATGFAPELVEVMVANHRHGYAGTLDAIGLMGGKRLLIDVKTSARVSADMGLQLAAYRAAEYVGEPGTATKRPLPPVDEAAILQLGSDGRYHLIPFQLEAEEFNAFLAARAIYQWQGGRSRIVKQAEYVA